jgi:hypothetical protein
MDLLKKFLKLPNYKIIKEALRLKNLKVITFALIFTLAICTMMVGAEDNTKVIYPGSPENIIIQMKTTPVSGFEMMRLTAIPEFTLYNDGRVIYTNTDPNYNVRVMDARLTTEEIADMIRFIDRQRFWDLNENPMNLTLPGLDVTTITVRRGELNKTVKIHGYKLAAYQQILPRGICNIYNVLSNFRRDDAVVYTPQKVSLYVDQFNGDIPLDSRIVDWNVSDVDLQGVYNDDNIAARGYRQVVLTGYPMLDTMRFLGNNTLYSNRTAYLYNYYKQGKLLYNVGYRPHLPCE